MTNDHITGLLPGFVRGDLSADDKQVVESHVATCVECRQELEDLGWFKEGVEMCIASDLNHIDSSDLYLFATNDAALESILR